PLGNAGTVPFDTGSNLGSFRVTLGFTGLVHKKVVDLPAFVRRYPQTGGDELLGVSLSAAEHSQGSSRDLPVGLLLVAPAEREQPQPDRVAGQAGEFRMGPRLVVDLDPAHVTSLSSASIPRCSTAISTTRWQCSGRSPSVAAHCSTAAWSRCQSSCGTTTSPAPPAPALALFTTAFIPSSPRCTHSPSRALQAPTTARSPRPWVGRRGGNPCLPCGALRARRGRPRPSLPSRCRRPARSRRAADRAPAGAPEGAHGRGNTAPAAA